MRTWAGKGKGPVKKISGEVCRQGEIRRLAAQPFGAARPPGMAGVQVLQEQKPAYAPCRTEGFKSSLPTPDKAKSPVKLRYNYLAGITRASMPSPFGFATLMPDRSQRSGRTKGSNRAYLLLIKQKAP